MSKKKEKKKGRRFHIGMSIDKKLKKGKLWAADAFEMGKNLTEYAGKKLRFIYPVGYDRDEDGVKYAQYDFFGRYDTVYVMLYKDIAITTLTPVRRKGK